jgi:hypothetical protein
MVNSLQMQQLAREYERDLVAAASRRPRSQLARHRSPRITARQRLGRSLIGLGVKLARDSFRQPEGKELLLLQPRLERRPLAR